MVMIWQQFGGLIRVRVTKKLLLKFEIYFKMGVVLLVKF